MIFWIGQKKNFKQSYKTKPPLIVLVTNPPKNAKKSWKSVHFHVISAIHLDFSWILGQGALSQAEMWAVLPISMKIFIKLHN